MFLHRLCIEDFNRIGMQTLSVITQKLRILQMAKKTKVSRFVFDGFKIRINQNCNVCTVFGPSFRRSKLWDREAFFFVGLIKQFGSWLITIYYNCRPDNLKSLFRPIVMVSPDVERIVEVSLLANGFKNVKSTAKRIIEFYKICEELLPQQEHCDFG